MSMRKLLLCILLLSANIGVWAQTVSGVWKYTVSSGKATIVGTTETSGTDISIPAQIDSYPVVAIGSNAFQELTGFTGGIVIPEGVTDIGSRAFYKCSGLSGTLTLPSSVKTIGNYAFYQCSKLTGGLTIPENITSIENNAFYQCSGFTGNLVIPKQVTAIGSRAFFGCSGFAGTLTIPEGVKTIGDYAFNGCGKLTGNLTIPSSVETIGMNAFYKCSGFDGNLTINEGTKTIGTSAFDGCGRLVGDLTIPSSVTAIGATAFKDCSRLRTATFASNGSVTLGDKLFQNCSELRYIDASNLSASVFSGVDVTTKFSKLAYTLLYLPEGATLSSEVENVVVGNACNTLKLYENAGLGANNYGQRGYEYGNAIIKSFTAESASYKGKSLTDDDVYTLYLPYETELPAEIEAYAISNYRSGEKVMVFAKHTGKLNAYTPYLLRRVKGSGPQTLDGITMQSVQVNTAPSYLANQNGGTVQDTDGKTWKFLGTTNPIDNATAATNRLYVLEANNTWRPVLASQSGGHVRSLRAFLQAPEGASGAPLIFMLDEAEVTTGLDAVETEVQKGQADIYTVEGRFVGRDYESLPRGLYVIGGKKVYKF